MLFCHAAQFGQPKPDTGSELRTATDAVKKELDVLFDAGRGACASLQIAGSSKLTTMELAEKLKLIPGDEDMTHRVLMFSIPGSCQGRSPLE
jgi:hypothetical protein